MRRRPPLSPRPDTLLPYTTRYRSPNALAHLRQQRHDALLATFARDAQRFAKRQHFACQAQRFANAQSAAIKQQQHCPVAGTDPLFPPLLRHILGKRHRFVGRDGPGNARSEEHTSELQSLMRISYAVFCLKETNTTEITYVNMKTLTKPNISQNHT